jgi:hypothetical protein
MDGTAVLKEVLARNPRSALRRIGRKAHLVRLLRNGARAFAMSLKKGLLGRFRDWQANTGLLKQKEGILVLADICMNTPVLTRLEDKLRKRPLR